MNTRVCVLPFAFAILAAVIAVTFIGRRYDEKVHRERAVYQKSQRTYFKAAAAAAESEAAKLLTDPASKLESSDIVLTSAELNFLSKLARSELGKAEVPEAVVKEHLHFDYFGKRLLVTLEDWRLSVRSSGADGQFHLIRKTTCEDPGYDCDDSEFVVPLSCSAAELRLFARRRVASMSQTIRDPAVSW